MAEVNIEAPWFKEVIKNVQGKDKKPGLIVRKMNMSPGKAEVQFFFDNGSGINVKNPPITIKPGEDHNAEIDLDLTNVGKIKDPKPYQRRLFQLTRKEAAKKASELLKT